jgi:hypothetical protein
MLKEEMVLALQGNEPGAWNAGCQLTPALERSHEMAAHKRRGGHPAEKIADVDIARDVEVPCGASGEVVLRCSSLKKSACS